MIVILMGVSGAGKTTVGRCLAERLGWEFIDGDDLHPARNIGKMAEGGALTDEDRWPWLRRLHAAMLAFEADGSSAIVACSALKESYRRGLLEGVREARVVFLRGEESLLEERLRHRRGHFFDPMLLASQFEALEEPADALTVEVDGDVETVVAAIADSLETR